MSLAYFIISFYIIIPYLLSCLSFLVDYVDLHDKALFEIEIPYVEINS